jgi:hypothetical protein
MIRTSDGPVNLAGVRLILSICHEGGSFTYYLTVTVACFRSGSLSFLLLRADNLVDSGSHANVRDSPGDLLLSQPELSAASHFRACCRPQVTSLG